MSTKVGEATFRPDFFLRTNGLHYIPVFEALLVIGGIVPGKI
jgi:hypothetical protein